jgi:hypothetical protein
MISSFRFAVILTLAIPVAGCETEVVSNSGRTLYSDVRSGSAVLERPKNAHAELSAFFGRDDPFSNVSRPAGAGRAATAAAPQPSTDAVEAGWDDSCAINLDELTGALLFYYSTHQQLPPAIDRIPNLSPSGAKISLTCPTSGKRYVYHPEGLKPPLFTDQEGNSRPGSVLILYDPEPSHQIVVHLTDGTNDYDVKKAVHLGIVMEPRTGGPNQPVQMSVEHIEPGILNMYLRRNPSATGPAARPVAPVW